METTIAQIITIIVHTIETSPTIQIGIAICGAFVVGAFFFRH